MNDTIRQLYERKSVRVFEEKKIEMEKKRLILKAAAMAPTAGDQQLERKKPERVPMEYLVHENGYQVMEAEELKRMFAKNAVNKEYEEWMAAFCKRKFNSEFAREMSRSVAEYLNDYSER